MKFDLGMERPWLMKMILVTVAVCAASVAFAVSDHTLTEFPRLAGETDDAPRFQRAVDACYGGGVLTVPGGDYTLAQTVFVTNLCSIEMSAGAYVKAVAKMDWMIKIDAIWQFNPRIAPQDVNAERYNLRYIGGTLDADGKASCLAIDNYRHFTLENATFLNGKRYGVGIETTGRGYEMIARNLYFKTLISGLAGNVGLYTYGGDSHYTDIVVVDYTTGVHFAGRGANVLTRIHVWGGPIKPVRAGELPEMLKESVCFRIDSSGETLRDCYADTGEIGFWVNGWEERLFGCRYFNNTGFKLKRVTILRQDRGTIWCDGCVFQKDTPETKLYSGAPDAKIRWGDSNIYRHFGGDPSAPRGSEPTVQPLDVDLGRQLFLDDRLLVTNSMTRTWYRPQKSPLNPVLKPETELERGGKKQTNALACPFVGGVWYDGTDRLFKCYYNAGWAPGIAYAISKDGLSWERPKLNPDGGNLVLRCDGTRDQSSVVMDPVANDGCRFKAYLTVCRKDIGGEVRLSKDGVTWTPPVPTAGTGDATSIFYNPFKRQWCFSSRGWNEEEGRLRDLAFDADFIAGARALPRKSRWLKDAVGGGWKKSGYELYNMDCIAYESVMIGLMQVMKQPQNEHWSKQGLPKSTFLRFGYAHPNNIWTWQFPKTGEGADNAFIDQTRRYGDWDMGYLRSNSGVCLIVGDEIRFYYTGFAGDKAKADDGQQNVLTSGMYANGAMGFATLRRDGFCSLQDGTVVTRPLFFTKGDRLFINADVKAGELVIRVAQDGKTFGEKRLANVDSTRLEVGALEPRKPFTLTFTASGGAKLYSFWTSDESGKSGGYLAGGSPDCAMLRDL